MKGATKRPRGGTRWTSPLPTILVARRLRIPRAIVAPVSKPVVEKIAAMKVAPIKVVTKTVSGEAAAQAGGAKKVNALSADAGYPSGCGMIS